MADARAATLNADLFIAIGSSLQVFPAAGFPVMAKQNRTPLVIVNREETGLDGLADLVVNAEIGPVMDGADRSESNQPDCRSNPSRHRARRLEGAHRVAVRRPAHVDASHRWSHGRSSKFACISRLLLRAQRCAGRHVRNLRIFDRGFSTRGRHALCTNPAYLSRLQFGRGRTTDDGRTGDRVGDMAVSGGLTGETGFHSERRARRATFASFR